jgi:hypothetical protein
VGWDKNGRYYTRSKKVNGRVEREYIGAGRPGALIAQLDELEREKRLDDACAWREKKTELENLDSNLDKLANLTNFIARAVLAAAGYYQHNRGEWRKRRAKDTSSPAPTGDP